MHVFVTGAAGNLGRQVVRELLARGTLADSGGQRRPIARIIGVDLRPDSAAPVDDRYAFHAADLGAGGAAERLMSTPFDSIFHLATVTSGAAEADFDLGMRANIDATRYLLDACRSKGTRPRFIYSSSGAVFGKTMPASGEADPPVAPVNSYGAHKAICELLIDDYTRRGLIDGCSIRLPTIFVRPDRAAAQATDFASDLVREAVAGRDVKSPLPGASELVVRSPRSVAQGLIEAHDARQPGGASGAFTMPALRVTVSDIVASLERVAGQAAAARVRLPDDVGATPALRVGGENRNEIDAMISEYLAALKNNGAGALAGGAAP